MADAQFQCNVLLPPTEIVDFVLNEVLPWNEGALRKRILDPACGSGIFLVEAYRRLIERQRRANHDQPLEFRELSNTLIDCIYGVDINEDAVRVTAFSLYLALLDFLEPKSIWTLVRFPHLIGSNLFVSDFFNDEAPFNADRYDVIVGNPPWQSNLSRLALRYIRRVELVIGDNQLAQAFLWHVPDLLAPNGRACLLAPSKGVLFNKSATNTRFRHLFFGAHNVTVVADFSLFRKFLFQHARAPMVAIFYRALDANGRQDEMRYYTPHPSPLSESRAGVIIAGDEVRRFSRREIIRNPDAWKIALWGTARDFELIEDLRARFPSLESVAQERGWLWGQGAQVHGGDQNRMAELNTITYIPATALLPFEVTTSRDVRIGADVFHRSRDLRLYKAPHVLLRRGVISGGIIAAVFLPYDAVFSDSTFGFAVPVKADQESVAEEDIVIFKLLCAYLNSSLARYYHFLTSSSWGIEREKIELNEHLTLPFAITPTGSTSAEALAAFVDRAQESGPTNNWQSELDDLVFDAYDLAPSERHLVYDTVTTTIEMFNRGIRATAFAEPATDELKIYAAGFTEVLNNALAASDDAFAATVYNSLSPYKAVSFGLAKRDEHLTHIRVETDEDLDSALATLGSGLLQEFSQRLYLRRNVKMIGSTTVHVVKPAERRYWTRSAAYNDADEIIAQLLRATETA